MKYTLKQNKKYLFLVARLIGSRAWLNPAALLKVRNRCTSVTGCLSVLPLSARWLLTLLIAGGLYSVWQFGPAITVLYLSSGGMVMIAAKYKAHAAAPSVLAPAEQRPISQATIYDFLPADSLIDVIPGIFLILDNGGRIIRYNANFAALLHKQPQDIQNKELIGLLRTDEKRDAVLAKLREVHTNGSAVAEVEIESDLGFTVYFNFSASRVVYGGATTVVIIGTDITGRKQLEVDLAAAQEQNRQLLHCLNHIPAGVVVTDAAGYITYVNKRLTEITGFHPVELIGKSPRVLKSGMHDTAFYDALWKTILAGREWRGEFYNRRKDGSLYWESAVITPLLDDAGTPRFFVAIKEDVTERRRKETELAEAREKAGETEKLRSYFFASMSHELRTPFVGIRSYAEILADTVQSPEAKQLAERIISSSIRLTDTLTNILTLARLEFEKPVLQPVALDMAKFINRLATAYSKKAADKKLGFSVQVLNRLPVLFCDEAKLANALQNLLDNAIKFTPEGNIVLSAGVVCGSSGNCLSIAVADTGIGISPDKQQKVWAPFRQESEGYNRSFEGTGLGLTISGKYIAMLGGTIRMESVKGEGSVFTVELPVNDSNMLG